MRLFDPYLVYENPWDGEKHTNSRVNEKKKEFN